MQCEMLTKRWQQHHQQFGTKRNGIIPKLRWNAMHCEWHVAMVLPCGNETNIVDSAIWLARVGVSELYSACDDWKPIWRTKTKANRNTKWPCKIYTFSIQFYDQIMKLKIFIFFLHTYHWTGWGCIDLDFFNNFNFQIYMNWVYFGKHVNYDILLKK